MVAGHQTTVEIICSALNAERYFQEFVCSLQRQTLSDWRLWLRDDGSSDGTVGLMRAAETEDARIRVLHTGGPRLGVAGGFGWLLERLPTDADYVMCADADDVWLPGKIARTLHAMREAEHVVEAATPILVHTDLVVVDEKLNVMEPSLWSASRIDPEPVQLTRLAIQNVVTAPTVMLNRSLRELVGETPAAARFQDWWYAMIAVAFGRVVGVPESTILYRQHGGNAVGARARAPLGLRQRSITAAKRIRTSREFRRDLRRTADQARAFLDRYGGRLSEGDRRFLNTFCRIPDRPFLRRKLDLLRYRVLPDTRFLETIGVLLRG